jgi:hypothetical protein
MLSEIPLDTSFGSSPSALGCLSAAVADDEGAFEVIDLEERLEMELGFENAATNNSNGAVAKQMRHGSSIERLGKIIAVLGPRYKTMPRDVLWEKATTEEIGPSKRRLLNEARERFEKLQEDSCRVRVAMDTEVDERIARRRWLEEKVVERRQVPMQSASEIYSAAALGAS